MEITIFAKKRNTKEGKIFYNFLSTLTRKDGSTLVCTVKFRDDAGTPKPEQCPMNIKLDKGSCNLSSKKFQRQIVDDSSGELVSETGESYTLWISKWEPGAPYVDHSMDDFV